VATAVGLYASGAQVVWNPLGKEAGATRLSGGELAPALGGIWLAGSFGYLNWILFLANLIPALPFDGGRVLRAVLGSTAVVPTRDNTAAFYTARAFALILGIAGVIRVALSWRLDGWVLLGMAVVIEALVRVEARMLEEGGYLDQGVFGYDFSEGYTSLEGSAAKVRPYRESALKRWRRRRSELRRQRRMAREAAEERRMDEILEKLHREGRAALTDEENRFLIRVSARYRNRTKFT
jgi:hypothetical protein